MYEGLTILNKIIKIFIMRLNKIIKICCKYKNIYYVVNNNVMSIINIDELLNLKKYNNNVVMYINNIDIDILKYLHNNNYVYNDDVILKSGQYSCYIDCLNKIYFINIRYKNIWFKIINLNLIYNKTLSIEDMKNNELIKSIKNIISNYGIESTFGKYAEKIFYKLNKKNKYKFIISEKCNDYSRSSFFGGLNYINKKYKNKILKNVNILDINSLYPFIMKYYKLPQFDGIYYRGEYKENKIYNLYIQHIKVDFKVKKDGIAFLKFNKVDFLDEVIDSSDGELIDLYLNNIDLKLFIDNYEIFEIYYIDGFMFSSSSLNFREYVDKFYKLRKKTKNKYLEKFYKLILNSLFGKFAKKKKLQKKSPIFNNNKIELKLSKKLLKTKRGYAPISSFVASYGRQLIIENIKKLNNDFIYTDTDSLHFINNENIKKFKISNKLGDFKIVEEKCEAKYLKLKFYIIKNKKGYKRILAGIPADFKNKVNFNNFKNGGKITIDKNIIKNGEKTTQKYIIKI